MIAHRALLLSCMTASSLPAPPAGFNYDEAKVPAYELPDPLSPGGTSVTTAAEWEATGRPATVRLFEEHVYGTRPSFDGTIGWATVEEGDFQVGGATARRRQFVLTFGEAADAPRVEVLLYLPANPAKAMAPVPIFLGLNFDGNHTTQSDPAVRLTESWVRAKRDNSSRRAREQDRGAQKERWPLEMILASGAGVATLYCGDVAADNQERWLTGVARALQRTEETGPMFSAIGLWSWALSQAREKLAGEEGVDANQIFAIGHSRLGKTALWTVARDTEFAGVVSNNSGCGGAALSRRRFGETVARINSSFPHWFNATFKNYNDRENACPVDQHQLIALIAPRPVYIGSASEDQWADPHGEFLSLQHAGPVFDLYDVKVPTQRPAPTDVSGDGLARAHLRSGPHDITVWDWERYLSWIQIR